RTTPYIQTTSIYASSSQADAATLGGRRNTGRTPYLVGIGDSASDLIAEHREAAPLKLYKGFNLVTPAPSIFRSLCRICDLGPADAHPASGWITRSSSRPGSRA